MNRKKKTEAYQIPPKEKALMRLKALLKNELWKKHQFKLHYSEATDILRHYLEDAWKIEAMEQTTDEILYQTHKIFESEINDELRNILQEADLTKFAKFTPSEEHAIALPNAIEKMIIQLEQLKIKEKQENESLV